MKRTLWFLAFSLVAGTVWAQQSVTPASTGADKRDSFQKAEQSVAFILSGDGTGRVLIATIGAIIREDGIILVPYHHVKGDGDVQVRLRNGEIFDQVELVGVDERRDIAALRIPVRGLPALAIAPLAAADPGEHVRVLSADRTMAWSLSDGVLCPIRMVPDSFAMGILGAGQGFQVVQFAARLPRDWMNGALVNSQGQLLGLLTYTDNVPEVEWAVPAESVARVAAQGLRVSLGNGKKLKPLATMDDYFGAPVKEPIDAAKSPVSAQTLSVASRTDFFNPMLLEEELINDAGFRALGINVVTGPAIGDLLVIVDRPLLTYDFTYAVRDLQKGVVLATGKVTAIDGPHAAPKIAREVVHDLEKARALHTDQTSNR